MKRSKRYKNVLIGLLMAICIAGAFPPVAAQQSEDASDTSLATPPSLESDTVSYFDVINTLPAIPKPGKKIPDSIIQKLKNDKDFWYANQPPDKEKRKEQPGANITMPFFLKKWFRVLMWTIIITTIAALLIWYLAISNIRLFRKAAPPILPEKGKTMPDDIFSIHYEKEIRQAEQNQDYRMVIRLLYLQTLKLLAENNLIKYRLEKTNSEYLWQLKDSPYYPDFFRLTREFDYTWYGHFAVSEEAFQTIRSDFQQFKKQVQS